MADSDQLAKIRAALVGDRHELYQTSALFHASIDALAQIAGALAERYEHLADLDVAAREVELKLAREGRFRD